MCRNIRTLYNFEPPATDDEIAAAALQFVRKVSGYNKPSLQNAAAFEQAVADVTVITRTLLGDLRTSAGPRDREEERQRAQARNARRFGTRSVD